MGKAKIIAIGNPKGGVGKTTTAVNLAYVLARDSKVLVCDLDGSCNLSKFIPFYDADFCSAFDLITGAYGIGADGRRRLLTADEIIIHGDGNLDLLSGDRELTHLELTLAHKTKEEQYVSLKNGLAPVTGRYDYIIMDTPANDKLAYRLSMSLDNVYLLVPMLGSRVSYDALTPIFEAFDEIRRTINPSLQFAGIFMNQADTRLNAYKYIAETLNEQMSAVGAKLFESTVRLAKGPIENAGLNRLPVVAAEPYCNVSLDFVNLAKELKQRIAEMEAKG